MSSPKNQGLFFIVLVGAYLYGCPCPIEGASITRFDQTYDLPIPAAGDGNAWMQEALLQVDQHLIIEDLNVLLNIEHTEISDLAIYLQGPAGQQVTLKQVWTSVPFRDPKVNLTQTCLDDQAQIPLFQAEPPYTGRFQCDAGSLLSIFNGQDAYGTWRLNIYDAYYADTGTLLQYQLEITHSPEPAGLLLYLIAAGYPLWSRKIAKKTQKQR